MAFGEASGNDLEERVAALDWGRITEDLDARGFATTGELLDAEICVALANSYDDDATFRSHIIMRRHGFGEGEYKYFAYPLPDPIERLRQAVYARLTPIANRWMADMGMAVRFPEKLDPFLARCHEAGQRRPTPLLLKYRTGDYNCLHQDLYGEHVFPIQLAILLSEPGRAFEGGDFVLTEQRPRMQSRVEVVPLTQGGGGAVRRERPPQTGHPRHLSGQDAPWRQPGPTRRSLHHRHHLPRRSLVVVAWPHHSVASAFEEGA